MGKRRSEGWLVDTSANGADGRCPLCSRPLVQGPSVNRHHWVPRSKGGRDASDVHVVCHRMIHRLFSEAQLAASYATPQALLADPALRRCVEWVQKKRPEYVDRPRRPRRR